MKILIIQLELVVTLIQNEIDKCDLQDQKHDDPGISTFQGIAVD
jgi:hypothetical protein